MQRYQTLFGKTRRDVPQEIESTNGQLLYRGGFIDPIGAGIYAWLPLGLRVLKRVQEIVREEMNAVGAQEVLMPALHPREYWEQTGRWGNVDVLFTVTSQTGKEYALGASHEEIVTPLAKKFIHSYRDLPFAVYQIQTKFRDELRAKGGVLRGREFGMKDCYSFHATPKDFAQFYERMLGAYARVYERCGVPAMRVRASGGIFTENISDEFHVESPSGEDRLLHCAACNLTFNEEVAPPEHACPNGHGPLIARKGIEVGNTFDLGTKYSDAVGVTFTDAAGETKTALMGCYGIGTTRLVGAIVERHHDDHGVLWPASVAPYDVHMVALNAKEEGTQHQIQERIAEVAGLLETEGYSVLVDDRMDVTAGAKFADADLIGIPYRAVVSERHLAAGTVEWKSRTADHAESLTPDTLLRALRDELRSR